MASRITRDITKYSFHDDYSEGAHPNIIEALAQTNRSQQSGYGDDEYSEDTRQAIRDLIGTDKIIIYFAPGGTGANLLSVASHLQPHEAVIAAESGHIVSKEGSAIEASGYKIIAAPGANGKLTLDIIQLAFGRSAEFAFQPKAKMVFISNATEIGTVYTKGELEAVTALCKNLRLLLLLDGARIDADLTSSKNDMSLIDIYNRTDVFWIGGTKNGALLGEAVIIKDPAELRYHMKQRGALLAKGRVLGIKFRTLFQDDLFFNLERSSNIVAAEISSCLLALGYKLWAETDSNQELQKELEFFIWEHLQDGPLVVRLVAS
ncbi:threonine aldolase [Lentithecium fluviatile CBS 122367]|uniref:Threonine aldolase n=1 Tax=Lentithecium fluviatile CBS 122367 TaxID=1168545 RepID=A0A6G1JJN9_9PLEO|nr:threonine aldolase [Lentithecium fluviatile CBS 122367]